MTNYNSKPTQSFTVDELKKLPQIIAAFGEDADINQILVDRGYQIKNPIPNAADYGLPEYLPTEKGMKFVDQSSLVVRPVRVNNNNNN